MSEVKKGSKVKVHYEGKLEDGTLFDSSKGREPLEFEAGSGTVIKGFDNAVIGMKKGEEKEFKIKSEDAYGERKEDLFREVPKEKLGGIDAKKGMMLQMQTPDGQALPVMVSEVKDNSVMIDFNHPLAGKNLVFNIKVEDIQ